MKRHQEEQLALTQLLSQIKSGQPHNLTARTGFAFRVSAGKKPRTLSFICSTEGIKRDGNNVRVAGWELQNYLKTGAPVLWCHDSRGVALGNAPDMHVDPQRRILAANVTFSPEGINPFADMVYRLYEAEVMRAGSANWKPLEWKPLADQKGRETGGWDFVRQELLEFSLCPVPADPDAITRAVQTGLLKNDEATQLVWRVSGEAPTPIVIRVETQVPDGPTPDEGPGEEPKETEQQPEPEGVSARAGAAPEEEEELAVIEDTLALYEQAGREVQAILCAKSRFSALDEATGWLSAHRFTVGALTETEAAYAFQQFAPAEAVKGTLRTIILATGIRAVLCERRAAKEDEESLAEVDFLTDPGEGTEERVSKRVHSLILSRGKFSSSRSAGQWAHDHGYQNGSISALTKHYRIPQHEGKQCRAKSTMQISPGVSASICQPMGREAGQEFHRGPLADAIANDHETNLYNAMRNCYQIHSATMRMAYDMTPGAQENEGALQRILKEHATLMSPHLLAIAHSPAKSSRAFTETTRWDLETEGQRQGASAPPEGEEPDILAEAEEVLERLSRITKGEDDGQNLGDMQQYAASAERASARIERFLIAKK